MPTIDEILAASGGTPSPSAAPTIDQILAQSKPQQAAFDPAVGQGEFDLPNSPTPERTPDVTALDRISNLGAGVNRGMMDLLDLPVTLTKAALGTPAAISNAALGTEFDPYWAMDKITNPSDALNFDGFVDKATGRHVPKGQDVLSDSLYTLGEFGGTAPVVGANVLSKGGTAVNALRTSAPDIFSGVGASAGNLISEGDPYAELIGSIAGAAGASRAGRLYETGKKVYEKFNQPQDTTSAALDNLVVYAEQGADIVHKAKTEVEAGTRGTLAQITGDGGLYNAEASVDLNSPQGRMMLQERALRDQQTLDMVNEVGGQPNQGLQEIVAPEVARQGQAIDTDLAARQADADAMNAQELQASALREEQLIDAESAALRDQMATQADVNEADRVVQSFTKDLDPDVPPSVASEDLYNTWSAKDKQAYDRDVQPLWDEFDGSRMPRDKLAGIYNNIFDSDGVGGKGLDATGFNHAIEHPDLRRINKRLEGWQSHGLGTQASAESVQKLLQELKDVRYNNSGKLLGRPRDTDVYTFADNAIGEIEGTLAKISPEFAEANSKHKAHIEQYRPDVYKDVKAGKVEPELFGDSLLKGNEKGAVMGDILTAPKTKAMQQKFETYLRSVAARDGVDANFMKNYDELLQRFPESQKRLEVIRTHQDKLAEAQRVNTAQSGRLTKAVEARQKGQDAEQVKRDVTLPHALEAAKKSLAAEAKTKRTGLSKTRLSKFLDAPDKTIKSLLNPADREANIKRFADDIESLEGGKDAFKQALISGLSDAKVENLPTGVEFRHDFTNSMVDLTDELIKNNLLTEADRTQMDDVLQRVIANDMIKNAKPLKNMDMPQWKRVASSWASSKLLSAMGQNSLIMMGAVRRFMLGNAGYKGKRTPEIEAEMARFMANPQEFLDAVEIPKDKLSNEAADGFLMNILTDAVDANKGRTAVRTAQTLKEED